MGSTVPDEAVQAALDTLAGQALFLKPNEMRGALEAAYPVIRATELAAELEEATTHA